MVETFNFQEWEAKFARKEDTSGMSCQVTTRTCPCGCIRSGEAFVEIAGLLELRQLETLYFPVDTLSKYLDEQTLSSGPSANKLEPSEPVEATLHTQGSHESDSSFGITRTPAYQGVFKITNESKKRKLCSVNGALESRTSAKIRSSRHVPAQGERSLGLKSTPILITHQPHPISTPPTRSTRSRMDIPLSISSTSVEMWENTSPLLRSRRKNSDRHEQSNFTLDLARTLDHGREAEYSTSCPSSPISNSCFSTGIAQYSCNNTSSSQRAPGEQEGEQETLQLQAGTQRSDTLPQELLAKRRTAVSLNEVPIDPCSCFPGEPATTIVCLSGSKSRIEMDHGTDMSNSTHKGQVLLSSAKDTASTTFNMLENDFSQSVTPKHTQASPDPIITAIETENTLDSYLHNDDAEQQIFWSRTDKVRAHRQPRIRPRDFVVPVSMFHKIVTRLHPGEK